MANAARTNSSRASSGPRGYDGGSTPIAALRGIIATPVPAVVKLLAFQMQADWRSYPAHVFAMDDESPDEVYFEPPFFGALAAQVQADGPRHPAMLARRLWGGQGHSAFRTGAVHVRECRGRVLGADGRAVTGSRNGRYLPAPPTISNRTSLDEGRW